MNFTVGKPDELVCSTWVWVNEPSFEVYVDHEASWTVEWRPVEEGQS